MLPGKIVKSSRGYEYAQEKIDKQQIRVQTLELVLMEHKKLLYLPARACYKTILGDCKGDTW